MSKLTIEEMIERIEMFKKVFRNGKEKEMSNIVQVRFLQDPSKKRYTFNVPCNEKICKGDVVQIRNKKASFEFFFIDTYTAGIVLTGTEIKSIRMGKASLVDAFCYINNGEIWVKGMNVSPYFYGSYNNHEAKRDRKLLLNKREIYRLQEATKQVGYTIVPTLIFIDKHGRAKIDIALAKGKKEFDKRQTLKEKEDRREMDRAIKRY